MTTASPSPLTNSPLDGAVKLDHLGVIRAQGQDAAAFLHGQLTTDISGLDASHATLAGHCSAKGRMLSSFVVWKPSGDEVLAACSADVLESALKKLSMFVLRARCKLSDASEEIQLFGLAGPSASNWLQQQVPSQVWGRSERDGASVIRLPDSMDQARFLWAGGAEQVPQGLPTLGQSDWHLAEVHSAIARLEAVNIDQFVPQMLNYELVGGVNFKKGCYPGQEIVARSQYRGTLKRRSFLFSVQAAAQAGQEIFHSEDPRQPAGRVVNAASSGPGEVASHLLAETKISALHSGSLHLGSPDGPRLQTLPMPYEVAQAEID